MKRYNDTFIIELIVNGEHRKAMAEPWSRLSEVLREGLGLCGARYSENGVAGTVLIDGWPADSNRVLAAEVEGSYITTFEGLSGRGGVGSFWLVDKDFKCCGYCVPGLLVTAYGLSMHFPHADVETAQEWFCSGIHCMDGKHIAELFIESEKNGIKNRGR